MARKYKLCGGNIKIGKTYSFSKLAGNGNFEVDGMGTVKGTCGKYCSECGNRKGCYVFKSYRYGSVLKNHGKNTIGMREEMDRLFANIMDQLRHARNNNPVRVNQSGEMESTEEVVKWANTAKAFPDRMFWFYTKAYDILVPLLLNGMIPNNVTVLISIWHECGIDAWNTVKHLPNVKAFVYDDGFNYESYGIKIETYCHAYTENEKGKVTLNHNVTCDRCKKCYDSKFKVIGTLPH